MISTIINNLIAFALSMPTNMIILLVICLILKVLGFSIKSCVKVIFSYLLIGFLLGLFGFTMPSFLTIGTWIVNLCKSLW